MRWLRPLATFFAVTALLIGVTLAVPRAASAGGRDDRHGAGGRECVTLTDPAPGSAGADGITGGPGGTWFSHGGSVDRITHAGTDVFAVPDAATADVGALASAPGGPVWFADRGNGRIGSIDARGRVTVYPIPASAGATARPQDIVVDGRSVRFTDETGNTIGLLDPRSGTVTTAVVPTAGSAPAGFARARDGALWFTERAADKVGRLAVDGTFREWPLAAGASPTDITADQDGAIWFTQTGVDRLGRIDGAGRLTEYPRVGGPVGITAGPGRALYVSLFNDGSLVRLDASGRETARWHLSGAAGPRRVAEIDGDIWTADAANDLVYRIHPDCTQPWVSADIATRSQAVLDTLAADAPGCSVAFAEKGDVVWTGVRGLADVPNAIPITPRTIFDAGSVAKQFTAAAILLLAQRHRLNVDDTLADHLDGFPAWAQTVTLNQMIHHTSGIPDFYGIFDAKGYWRTDHVTQQIIVDELRAVPALEYTPGNHFEYSNSNYVLLAEVVAKVSGVDFPTFLRRQIFDPLNLNMVVDAINPIPGRAINYDMDTGVLRANDNERWEPIGEGALQTTPSELVKWADNYRRPRVGGPQLVAAQLGDTVEIFPGGPRYGAGLFVGADGRFGHGGDWLGFQTGFWVSADQTRSATVSCNSSAIDINDIGGQLNAIWVNPPA